MSHASSSSPISRSIPIFMGTVMLLAILLAAFGRMAGLATSQPTAAPVASRELLFRDQPNGAVAIFDAKDPVGPISIAAPGTNGFLRATLRGLARQRLRLDSDRRADEAIPFRLTEWADGRLTLEDPTTHRTVEMEAFGITNEEVFAHLLAARPITDRTPTTGQGELIMPPKRIVQANARRLDVPCTVEIEQTPQSLHAYVTPEGVEIGPGDRVLVHGAPSSIGYNERVTLQCHATVFRATVFGRFWAHVTGLLSLVELYEVGFEPKECT